MGRPLRDARPTVKIRAVEESNGKTPFSRTHWRHQHNVLSSSQTLTNILIQKELFVLCHNLKTALNFITFVKGCSSTFYPPFCHQILSPFSFTFSFNRYSPTAYSIFILHSSCWSRSNDSISPHYTLEHFR